MRRLERVIAACVMTAAGFGLADGARALAKESAGGQTHAGAPVFLRGVRKALTTPETKGVAAPQPAKKTQMPQRKRKAVPVQAKTAVPVPKAAEPEAQPAFPAQSVRTQMDAEAAYLHLTGLTLSGSAPGQAALETVLNFTGAVDPKLAEDLNKSLPGWIEYATSGYDTLLIRTKRKAAFSVTEKPGGVTVRIAWAPPGPEEPRLRLVRLRYLNEIGETAKARMILGELRGSELDRAELLKAEGDILAREQDPRAAFKAYDAAIAMRPAHDGYREARDNLRKRYADQAGGTATYQTVEGGDRQWRAQLTARAAIDDQATLLATVESVDLETDSVLNPDCTVTPFSGVRTRFDVRYQFDYGGGEVIEGAVFAAESIAGLGLSYRWLSADQLIEIRAAWAEPTFEYVESIAHNGARDSLGVRYEAQHRARWFYSAGLRLNNYSVESESSVATTVSAEGTVRYREPLSRTFALTAAYALDAEYVQSLTTLDHGPVFNFALLPIVDREVHSVSVGIMAEFERLWTLDAEAGYAIDRYAEGGIFGRTRLAYLALPNLEISADASYSAVSSRGDGLTLGSANSGAVTTAAFNILYTFDAPGSLFAAWGTR